MRNVSTVYQRRVPQHLPATPSQAGRVTTYRRIKCESPRSVHPGLHASAFPNQLRVRKGSLRGSGDTPRSFLDAARGLPGHERACIPVISVVGFTTNDVRAGEADIRLSAPNHLRFVREARPPQNLRRLVATSRPEPVGNSLINHGRTNPRQNNGGGTTQDHPKSPEHPTIRHFNASTRHSRKSHVIPADAGTQRKTKHTVIPAHAGTQKKQSTPPQPNPIRHESTDLARRCPFHPRRHS